MRTLARVLLAVACACGAASGCASDRYVRVQAGVYEPTRATGEASEAVLHQVASMVIDRESATVTWSFADGRRLAIPFTPRDREDWPSGCPANLGSTRMEVLDLEAESLTLNPLELAEPILVRDCPPQPEEVALRADGEVGGPGSACVGAEECLVFALGEGDDRSEEVPREPDP